MASFAEYTKNKKKKNSAEGVSFTDYTKQVLGKNDIESPTYETYKQDIAPVKQTATQKQNEERAWFQKGAFEDGYQFGDVSKAILGTLDDVGENVDIAVFDATENLIDTVAYGVGAVGGLFGADEFKEGTKKFIARNLQEDVVDWATGNPDQDKTIGEVFHRFMNWQNPLGIATNLLVPDTDEASVLGERSDSLVQSGAHLAGQLALQYVGVPWWLTSGVNSFGSEIENAFQEDATYAEAGISGGITAGAEIFTEKLFGGVLSKTGLDDVAAKKFGSAVASKFTSKLGKWGIKAAGEGAEEVITDGLSKLGQKLTYEDEKTWEELFLSEEALDQYLESFIGGFVIGGIGEAGQVYKAESQGVDYVTGLTDSEQKVIDKLFDEIITETEKNYGKLSTQAKTKIYDELIEKMEKGSISTDTIEEVLGGETYKAYKDTVDNEAALQNEFEELGNKQNATLAEQTRYNELKEQIEELKNTSQKDSLKTQLTDEVLKAIKDTRLVESYNERERRGIAFEADLSQYEEKYQGTIKKAVESGILNNTRRTHEFVDMVAKISADKGVLFDFANNEKIAKSSFAVEGKTVNGYVDGDGNIVLNIDSSKALESTTGHEITHILEGTELYDTLAKAITDYAKSKGDYDGRLETLNKLYEGVYEGEDFAQKVNKELVADLVGDYVFTDKDFVRKLSVENRNVFQKIYDEIKYLCKVATAGSKEARALEKVKKTFAEVYRESGNTNKSHETDTKTNKKYSLSAETDTKYNEAVKNNDIETAQKIVEETARNAGYTIKAYHGGDKFFTVFGKGNKTSQAPEGAHFFSSNKDVAYSYTGYKRDVNTDVNSYPIYEQLTREGTFEKNRVAKGGVYASFLKLENPYVVDFKGEYYSHKVNGMDINEIAEYARQNGYDGVIAKNIKDPGDMGDANWESKPTLAVADDYIVFDPKQIKSAEPITYDNDGDVIPLSERFKADNPDIRYSVSDKNITDVSTGYAYNETYYTMSYKQDGKVVGTLEYGEYEGKPNVKMIEVIPEYRRKGIGTKLLQALQRKYPEQEIDFGMSTPDGTKLLDAITYDVTDKNIVADRQKLKDLQSELNELQGKLDVLYDTENLTEEQEAEMRRLGDRWEEVYQTIHELEPTLRGKRATKTFVKTDVKYSLSADSEGNKLSAEQKEYFKDSKIVDDNGNLLVMYHGTPETFTVFDRKKAKSFGTYGNGFYFSDSNSHAGTYGETLSVYLNITNPLKDGTNDITKEQLRKFVEAIAEDEDYGIENYGYGATIDSVVDSIYGKSDFGKILDLNISCVGNMVEAIKLFNEVNGTDYNGIVAPTETVAFYPEQIKRVDNKSPTSNADIRYSLSEADNTYLSAVKKGDTETVQRLVDEAAENSGYTIRAYHGTPNTEFTVFDKERLGKGNDQYGAGFYFASDKTGASHYGNRVINAALDIKNPIRITATGENGRNLIDADIELTSKQAYEVVKRHPDIYDEENSPLGDYFDSYWESGAEEWMIRSLAEQYREVGYLDSDLFRNYPNELHEALRDVVGYDGVEVTFENTGEKFYVAWFDNQMKSVEPITYDNSGQVIPLSERFDKNKNDIRYSHSEQGEHPIKQSNLTYGEDIMLETAPIKEATPEVTEDILPDDYAPITEEEAIAMNSERLESLDDTDAPPETSEEYYSLPDTSKLENEALEGISNTLQDTLLLTEKETKAIQDVVQKYSTTEFPSKEELFEEIRDNFGEKVWTERNEEAAEVKETLRKYKIDVSKAVKSEFTEYAQFMRSHFGKIRFAKDGVSVDQAYLELSEMYPSFFPDDIYNPADQLERIAEVADMGINTENSIMLDDETIQEAVNIISEGVNAYKQMALQAEAENVSNAYGDDIAPIENIKPKEQYEAIKPKPKKQPKLIRVKDADTEQQTAKIHTEEPTTKKKKRGLWSFAKEYIFDKGMVFESLSKKTKNRELEAKWNFIRYADGNAQTLIGNGKEGVKALKDIQADVEKAGLTEQLYNYLYHKHNVDRMTLAERYENVENKPVFGNSVTAEMSQAEVERLEKVNPELKAYANEIYNYNQYLRNKLVDGGVISQETADLWNEMYPHYVPIRRVGDTGLNINVPLDTGKTGVNAPIKRATGGNRDILPLFDTMAQRTLQTYKAAAKNSFGVELKNTLGTTIENTATSLDEVIDSIDTQEELLQKGKNGKSPTFTVFENGEKVTFEITEEMYDALKPKSEILSYRNKFLSTVSNIQRGLLTEYNPVFMLTNAVKDVQDVLINSQHATKTYANFPQAIGEMLSKGKYYTEYMENGGGQNTYFDNDTNTFAEERKGIKKLVGMPLDIISGANNIIERLPRLAEYIASRKSGRSVEVSMLDAARVTTNFAAGGDITKFLNANGCTFLSASVNGAVQQARNFQEAKMNGFKGWVGLATKFAVAGIPAMLLNSLMWDDDEDYEELSDYVKDNYYIVAKTEDGQFIRIPKGRALAVIQNAMEQIKNAATGDDEVDLKNFLDLAVSNLAPNNPLDSNVFAPIIQVLQNKTWYGEDLVPTRLQDLPANEQFDESTDALSKWLGEKINYSPYKINYLLNQYSGGVGDVVLPMLTPEAESGDNSLQGNLLAPMKDKFTTDSVMNNQNVSDFYDTVDELTTNAKSSTATDEDILKYKYMNSINAELGELYGRKREIQNSNLTDKEKYSQVREIQEQINSLAKESLNTYNNVNIDGKYANIGNLHYRWYEPSETSEAEAGWQKITDKQLEKQEEVTSSLGITPTDYWSNKEEYDYAYEYPEKYAIAKSVGGYETYKTYTSELYDIKADKDESGKSISGSRKEKVIEYINNLDADYGEKIILFKSQYNADDTYNYEIIDYLNSRDDISYEEMETILKELGFTVKADGTIQW